MPEPRLDSDAAILQELLGYLNFSSGASDPQFLANLDRLYRRIEGDGGEQPDTCLQVRGRLGGRLEELAASTATFRDCTRLRGCCAWCSKNLAPPTASFIAICCRN